MRSQRVALAAAEIADLVFKNVLHKYALLTECGLAIRSACVVVQPASASDDVEASSLYVDFHGEPLSSPEANIADRVTTSSRGLKYY